MLHHSNPLFPMSILFSSMGAAISDFGSGRTERSPDCVINGRQYRIEGTYNSRDFFPNLNGSEFSNWR